MAFPDTRWSQITLARGREPLAQAALADLCAAYYQPVLHFFQQQAHAGDDAREWTQEFFRRILAGTGVDTVNPARGRFRTWLLGAARHFLSTLRQHQQRQKRTTPEPPQPQPPTSGDSYPDAPDPNTLPPDLAFDREWAMTLLQRTLHSLESDMAAAGNGTLFSTLTPFLTGHADYGTIAEAAASLGTTAGALRVSIHRLRQRYRDLLHVELAQTLAPGASIEEELNSLKSALRSPV